MGTFEERMSFFDFVCHMTMNDKGSFNFSWDKEQGRIAYIEGQWQKVEVLNELFEKYVTNKNSNIMSTEAGRPATLAETIAPICHAANKAWCEANGDWTQNDWREAEQWQRESAVKGVQFKIDNPNAGEDAQHNAWMADKVNDGWAYGSKKDAEAKTHPCIVPFDQLPEFQQKKDKLFCAIVDALK